MKKILLWLICISILRGVTYIVITPPWQAPDETTHFQFMELLTQRSLGEIRSIELTKADALYVKLEQKILESMKKYRAWEYVGLPTPDPLPGGFWETHFFVGSAPKIYRPPLYYLMGAGILKVFHPKDLETRLYVVRLYSLLLSLGTVIVSCLIGYLVFKDKTYALMTGAFVSFLPQFMVIGTSVNSDNLVNLLASVFILYAVFIVGEIKSNLYLIPVPFLLLILFLSGRTSVAVAPMSIVLLSSNEKIEEAFSHLGLFIIDVGIVHPFGGIFRAWGDKRGNLDFEMGLGNIYSGIEGGLFFTSVSYSSSLRAFGLAEDGCKFTGLAGFI